MSTEVQTDRQPLEERITYCEQLVDTLNGVVTDLQKRVSALELQNRQLIAAFQQQQEEPCDIGMANEKPPHY